MRSCPRCSAPFENDGDRIYDDQCWDCGWSTPARAERNRSNAATFAAVRAAGAKRRRRRHATFFAAEVICLTVALTVLMSNYYRITAGGVVGALAWVVIVTWLANAWRQEYLDGKYIRIGRKRTARRR